MLSGISFSIVLTLFSLSCLAQNLTTQIPEGMGMSKYLYILTVNNQSRAAYAKMNSTNDTIHICPYMLNSDKKLFKAVTFYEYAQYYDYDTHGEVIKNNTSNQDGEIDYIIDSVYRKTPVDLNKVIYIGGDGSSLEKAIIIKNAKTIKEGITAEYAYIEKELGQRGVIWKPLEQCLVPDYSKYYDVIKVKFLNSNEIRYFWFDITKFFGKY